MKLSDVATERLKKSLRILIQVVIFGVLFYQLYDIGLDKLVDFLPTAPLFYVLYLFIYFSLPIAEIFIYRLKWPISWKGAFPIFIQKKVLNTDVVGYSGEVYLYHWAKKSLGIKAKEVAIFIKDNNIISSVASTFITLVLLYYFATKGYISIHDYLDKLNSGLVLGIGVGVVIVGMVAYQFRRHIIHLNKIDALKIFSLHASRIVFINVLQIFQYKVAIPEIPLDVWFSVVMVQILASRLPLPSTDALFTIVALQFSGSFDISNEMLSGVLSANLVLKRVLNVLTYVAANFFVREEIDEQELVNEQQEIETAE